MQTKQASLEKQERNEAWYKIAVKIMRWKDGNSLSSEIGPVSRITSKEWNDYCEKIIAINVSNGKNATLEKLRELEEVIKHHNGFEQA